MFTTTSRRKRVGSYTAAEKMQKARTLLVLDAPFFGQLSLKVKMGSDPNCQTAWVDGLNIGYNPDYIEGLTMDQTKGLLCKLIMHPACGHHLRRGTREQKRWQKACDEVICPLIEEAGFELPQAFHASPDHKGKSAERIYELLPEEAGNQDPGPQKGGDGDGDGDGGGKGGGQDDQDQDGGGNDPNGNGEVRDLPPHEDGSPRSETEKQQNEQDWKEATKQADNTTKGAGTTPGCITEMVADMLAPKVDWKEQLWQWLESNAKGDYTWVRPNKRYVHMGLYLPSLLNGKDLMRGRVYVDTSGSVRTEELKQFGGELSSILEEFPNVELTCNCFDTRIVKGKEQVFHHEDLPIELQAIGRGGTEIRPVFKHIEESCEEDPKFVIIFTDMGFWDSLPDKPEYPVLFVNTGPKNPEVEYGTVIDIDIDGAQGYW